MLCISFRSIFAHNCGYVVNGSNTMVYSNLMIIIIIIYGYFPKDYRYLYYLSEDFKFILW